MLDAAGFFERDLSDGLGDDERAILRHWDGGATIAAIAAATGQRERRVRHVVELYDDRAGPRVPAALVEANRRFVAAERAVRRRQAMMEVSEIEALLEDQIESLARDLFPNAIKHGHEICVGSIAGEKGQSLRIHVGPGAKRGWAKDYALNQGWDALNLIRDAVCGGDIKRAVAWAKAWLRLEDSDPKALERVRIEATARREERKKEAEAERARSVERAKRCWHQGVALVPGDPVDRYLASRGIDLAALAAAGGGHVPGALRYREKLQYGWQGPSAPAMVAMVTNLAGEHVATHRTWIRPDGSGKAGADLIGCNEAGEPNDPKKIMGAPWGGHIALWKGAHRGPLKAIPPGTDVYVSEGIEDGLTVACADPSLRVICMIALSYLIGLELPAQIGRLVILKQNDPPGSPAAKALARAVAHHRAAGVRVAFVEPPAGVKDLNDLAKGV